MCGPGRCLAASPGTGRKSCLGATVRATGAAGRCRSRLFQAVQTAYEQGFRHFLCGMAGGAIFGFARRCCGCGESMGRFPWRRPFPMPGRRSDGIGPIGRDMRRCWLAVTIRRYCRRRIRRDVCSGATGIWWTMRLCSLPCMTGCPGGRSRPLPTRLGGDLTSWTHLRCWKRTKTAYNFACGGHATLQKRRGSL